MYLSLRTKRTTVSSTTLIVAGLAIAGLLGAPALSVAKAKAKSDAQDVSHFDPELFESLEFRNIGPFRGGRSTAVTGVTGDPLTFYMGTTGGGVWKTADGGGSWKNISDDHFNTASIGALAVAPSDHNVLYAGTGSACPRGNVSPGDGVYRSTDAGKTWSHAGLEQAGQIGRIHVHPQNPDLVYVAALGHIFGPNDERGVFRSSDGGSKWDKVLHVSDTAGAVDLSLDPKNPRILFAAIWEAERKPWTLISGGEQSGLYRSNDSGDTWEELTDGLPDGIKGRIGVTVSPANPNRVWALIEAEDGGLFRSENGGDTFRMINPDRNFRQRAWYYTHVFADPQDTNTVYILNTGLWRSIDGGKSFEFIRAPHGDHHDLWIHPENTQVLINANDGGANISYNGGKSWSTQRNQPTSEMYRVTVDQRFPYHIYGCQQDNSCVAIPSRTSSSGIGWGDWYVIGGCESGHVAVDPRDPNVTYSGCYGGQIGRYDHSTDQEREITDYPQVAIGQAARDLRYRFQWNAPIRISPHNSEVLYHASQYLHRSTNEGQSWDLISPDLTRDDVEKQGFAGEPITMDNTGVEVYDTIFAFEESPLTAGLLWVGTDDGLVHLSRDNGENWTDITPSQMPEWGQVNSIELSSHDPGRAFIAVTRYKFDDFQPYIFRTDDYGASWQLLTSGSNGIPKDHFVRVVREDPDRQGLLYAGTEFGLYVSFDEGSHWQSLQQNLPITPITDMAITQQDLVVATQGRSFWILDDLTPLHQLSGELVESATRLLQPRDSYRFGGGSSFGGGGSTGQNPPAGASIQYWFSSEPEEEVTLEILDDQGKVLRTLSSEKEEPQAPSPWRRFMTGPQTSRKLAAKQGLNRYVWNLRLTDASLEEDAVLWGMARGPKVPPGTYRARLTVGEFSAEESFEILGDPRLSTTAADYQEQFDLGEEIWQALTESHDTLATARDVRQQIASLTERLLASEPDEALAASAKECQDALESVEDKIYQKQAESSQDVLNFPPQLDNQLLGLLGMVNSGNSAPTAGSYQRYQDLRSELDAVQAELQEILVGQVEAFSDLVKGKQVPAIIVPAL